MEVVELDYGNKKLLNPKKKKRFWNIWKYSGNPKKKKKKIYKPRKYYKIVCMRPPRWVLKL